MKGIVRRINDLEATDRMRERVPSSHAARDVAATLEKDYHCYHGRPELSVSSAQWEPSRNSWKIHYCLQELLPTPFFFFFPLSSCSSLREACPLQTRLFQYLVPSWWLFSGGGYRPLGGGTSWRKIVTAGQALRAYSLPHSQFALSASCMQPRCERSASAHLLPCCPRHYGLSPQKDETNKLFLKLLLSRYFISLKKMKTLPFFLSVIILFLKTF